MGVRVGDWGFFFFSISACDSLLPPVGFGEAGILSFGQGPFCNSCQVQEVSSVKVNGATVLQ